jgi:hypothetical protein
LESKEVLERNTGGSEVRRVFREGEGCLRVREFEAEKERRSFRSQRASNRFSEV